MKIPNSGKDRPSSPDDKCERSCNPQQAVLLSSSVGKSRSGDRSETALHASRNSQWYCDPDVEDEIAGIKRNPWISVFISSLSSYLW